MPILSRIRLFYSCHLSKPQSNRPIYRAIRRLHARKIVELGIASGQRALRMIEVAKLASPGEETHYVGVDPFEGRSEADSPGLTLKAAHQLLRRDGVRVQLVPGDLADSLVRIANSLGKVDLLIVPAALEWRHLPGRGSSCRGCYTSGRWCSSSKRSKTADAAGNQAALRNRRPGVDGRSPSGRVATPW